MNDVQSMHEHFDDNRDGYRWDDYRHEDTMRSRLPVYKRRYAFSVNIAMEWLKQCENPYIAVSGGKDSVCVVHLVQSAAKQLDRPLAPVMWHDSGYEWPGSRLVIERLARQGLIDKLHIARPSEDVLELKRQQARGEISAKQKDQAALFGPVDELVKKEGFDGVALGLRQEESRGRRMDGMIHGPIHRRKDGLLRCNPISRWTWEDVFACAASHCLPLHPIYSAPLYQLENRGRIRLSWWLSTDHWRHGEIKWVRSVYPKIYAEIIRLIPEVSQYA